MLLLLLAVKSCQTLHDPIGCSLSVFFVYRIFLGKNIGGSLKPRDQTSISCIADKFFITEKPGDCKKLIILDFSCICNTISES